MGCKGWWAVRTVHVDIHWMCHDLVGSEMVVLYVPKDVGDARHCAVDNRSKYLLS